MHDLVAQGKVLYWGTSEWNADQITEAHGHARALNLTPPTMEQPQYNMFVRDKVERDYKRLYEGPGLGTTIWSPLASGILTGKYSAGIPDDSRMALEQYKFLRDGLESVEGQQRVAKAQELATIANDLGCSLAQLAIAWCLTNENVSSVILGASRASQLTENLAALDVLERLDGGVLERIEGILGNKPEPPQEF
jgi:aryl-alcohol dehydrogenase-like predicted oxidoreductase